MNTSSINFASVFDRRDLARYADKVRDWFDRHQYLPYFSFDLLAKDLGKDVPLSRLLEILIQLVDNGQLKVRYRVDLGDGTLSDEEFDSVDDIPPTVFDSDYEPVEVEEDAKVPVYTPAVA